MFAIIVPNYVADAINAKLDAAIAEVPEAESSRAHLYDQLLAFWNEHGSLPEFSLAKNEEAA